MKTAIQIGKVRGILIKIHNSFLLVLVLFLIVFSNDAEFGFADVASAPLRYALALALTILLCSCVLLHELGQLLVQDTGSITGIVSGTDFIRLIEVIGYNEK